MKNIGLLVLVLLAGFAASWLVRDAQGAKNVPELTFLSASQGNENYAVIWVLEDGRYLRWCSQMVTPRDSYWGGKTPEFSPPKCSPRLDLHKELPGG